MNVSKQTVLIVLSYWDIQWPSFWFVLCVFIHNSMRILPEITYQHMTSKMELVHTFSPAKFWGDRSSMVTTDIRGHQAQYEWSRCKNHPVLHPQCCCLYNLIYLYSFFPGRSSNCLAKSQFFRLQPLPVAGVIPVIMCDPIFAAVNPYKSQCFLVTSQVSFLGKSA